MAHIPPGTNWYLAELIMEITVEQEQRNVVHRNLHLLRADTPDAAYQKAHELGRKSETSYTNVDDRIVNHQFRGLSGLSVIHDDLEDGAELRFEEMIAVPEE